MTSRSVSRGHQPACLKWIVALVLLGAGGLGLVARRIHERFRSGTTIKVYYDPRHPHDAVLPTGVQGFHLYNLAFFAVFFGIPYWALSG